MDHGFVNDINEEWHLWASIRGTKKGRIHYKWKGNSLIDSVLWEQQGIAARVLADWGEQKTREQEQIQAPYFFLRRATLSTVSIILPGSGS